MPGTALPILVEKFVKLVLVPIRRGLEVSGKQGSPKGHDARGIATELGNAARKTL